MNRVVNVFIGVVVIVIIISAALLFLDISFLQREATNVDSPRQKIRIALITHPYSTLVAVAHAKEFFRAEGLETTLQPYAAGKEGIEAVIAGKADLTTAADTGFAEAILKGGRVQAIAVVATSELSHSIVGRRDRGITQPSDLRGKKIGVTKGTFGEFNLDTFLTLSHIAPQHVHAINLKPGEMVNALLHGDVDAVSTWEPFTTILRDKLGPKVLEFDNKPPFTTSHSLVVIQDYHQNNSLLIKKALRALLNAEKYIKKYPNEARTVTEHYIEIEDTILEKVWGHYAHQIILDQNFIIRLEEQARWLIDTKQAYTGAIPNFLNHIYVDGLTAVAPHRVTVIHPKKS